MRNRISNSTKPDRTILLPEEADRRGRVVALAFLSGNNVYFSSQNHRYHVAGSPCFVRRVSEVSGHLANDVKW